MKTKQVMVKATKNIIAEADDSYYYYLRCFGSTALGDHQKKKDKRDRNLIRMSFYDDICKKYDLPRKRIGQFLKMYDIEVLRSLVVFGEHEYIVDKIRALQGTF